MLLKEIRLQTRDISGLKNFYRQVLKLEVEEDEQSLTVHTQQSLLVFETVRNNQHPFYHFAFNIPYNKVEEAQRWLQPRVDLLWMEDYKATIAGFTDWHARSVYFYDPAGNILELIGRADLNDNTNEPFSSRHIRNISEIGLVFPQEKYQQEVQQLVQQHRLGYFDKQEPLEQFCAIGDDHGLLICVPDKRNWYPTHDKPSGIYPMKLKIEEGGRELELSF